jgi:choline dehydrogenase-like flavoprotein
MDLESSSLEFAKRFARSLQRGDTTAAQAADALRRVPLMVQMAWTRYAGRRLLLPPDVKTSIELCAEQFPNERNLIELSEERDPMGIPKARLHWRPMAADERTLRATADRLRAYWTRHDLDRRAPLDWIEACRDPTGQITEAAVDYAHPSGTVRMGTDRNSSVVGPDLVCHDVPNLSVVSAAVFPSAGSANPTFTLLALAMRHADALLAANARTSGKRFGLARKAPSSPTLSRALS